MAFLSELIGRPVTDVDGIIIGKLSDVVSHSSSEFQHPIVEGITVKSRDKTMIVPFTKVAALISKAIPLKCRAEEITPFTPGEQDVFLKRDVMDKQIIDTDGARVVRVNDLELVRVNGSIIVSNVDVGGLGLLRRVGLEKAARAVAARLRLPLSSGFISWDDVELLRYDQSMRLRVPRAKLADLHPADVAEIIDDLNRLEGGQVLEALSVKQLADTLEEVEPEYQASLVQDMSDEKVADVLEEMEPDEAADLLAELPKDRSAGLLALMEKDEAEDVRKLLAYPEDSAGGIMTTEFVSVPQDITADQTIQHLRQTGSEAETLFYVYVTDHGDHLLGVFSLKSLIFAQPETLISDLMVKRLVSVSLLDKQDQVAQVIAKYDLLAVPVVDDQNRIQGIVTSDDALDKIIPTAWKKRLPRFYR
jgi:magnesium transporter